VKKLHIQKVNQRAEFDLFAVMDPQKEDFYPVVLDADTRTGEAYLLTDTERGWVPEDVWSGATQRFTLPIVPTPWSAQSILERPYVVEALQDLIDSASDDYRADSDAIAGAENAIERACENALGIAAIDSKEWFSDRKDRDIYDMYDFDTKEDGKIVERIKKDWHGCCIAGDYVLYLTDIDLYVRSVRGSVENTD
jgi:hypothetical protein